EKRFRDVTNSMDEVLILLGTDLRIQLLNKAARKIYGVKNDDYIGRPCHEVFWDCNDICEHCPTLEVMANGKVARAMRHMPDGRILARSIYPVYDNDGTITACAVLATDVTEREKHLEELTRYEQILSTNTDLIAYYDRNHMCLAINNVMAEYYNTTADKLIGKHASEIIGQDRYQHYLQYQDAIFKQKKQFSFNSWIDFPATGLVHMQITFTPYVDEDGSASGVVARLKNITEQTEQEAKLNLSAKVFETTTEGITITDKDGTIEAVNPAFCRITGYSEAEILGENPRLLKSGRHDDTYYKTMWQALEQSGHWQGEIWNKKKDGEVYPEWLTINAMYDDDDQVKHYVAVFTDMTTMNEFIQKLDYQTHHHPLTGLPNRLLLQVRLEHSIQRATKGHYQGAVFCIDLDNFKHINDSLGHAAGDVILLEVADRLKEHSRAIDTVAHLSADEFILVLDKVRSTDDAVTRAEQFLHRLSQPFMIDNYELFVTASLGVTMFPTDSDNVDELLNHADVAMHKAKESGKNGYHIYSPELTDAALKRVVLESNLRRALDNKEFILHYQPQVVLPEGKIIACEVLVRWLHPEMGLIPPDKFIPLSEETGIIIAMGEWILRTACQQWVDWNNQGLKLGKIAVNLSGRQIQQQDLPRMVQRILQETGCPAEALELEITEGFMMQHPEEAIAVLEQINALGVELSVDDFGTGHSSLSYLKRFPIHRLKIDRSFIRDMENNAEDHALVKTIIAMGNSLNLKITAEGIETEEQKRLLADLRCDEAQGYLFSKPVPAEEFAKLL
ncbi:MAG: EAL domain-containing protein, partial [Desulfuromonas sp.]|nr:EAL domain-containing protein [Desulfuromonas sp.]